MQGTKDNETFRIDAGSYDIAVFTNIGDRDEQQDSYGLFAGTESAFFVLCDGMGGYRGGRIASRMAVETVLDAYDQRAEDTDPVSFLQEATKEADKRVSHYHPEDGTSFDGGTTLVSVLLYKRYLYWNSVGDSRVYLFRSKDDYAQLTQDQNYRTVIDAQLHQGKITKEEYSFREKKAHALINYIGIGDIELIDYNHTPVLLKQNDKLLLTSDGLYRYLDDEAIAREVLQQDNVMDTLNNLSCAALKNARELAKSRDNLTMILINVK